METVVIKMSKDNQINACLIFCMILAIPALIMLYYLLATKDSVVFYTLLSLLILILMVPLIGFLTYKIELKADIILSNDNLTLSPRRSSVLKSSVLMQRFSKEADKILSWKNILEFHLADWEERRYDKESVYSITMYSIGIVLNDERETQVWYNVRGLDQEPGEIFTLFKKFHDAYSGHPQRRERREVIIYGTRK